MSFSTIPRHLFWLVFLLVLAACAPAAEPAAEEQPDEPEVEEPAAEPPSGKHFAVVQTSEGDITLELLPDLAPKTVENFITLARKGFYYNSLFHRVMPGTMIQGGDPNSKDNDPYNDGQGNSGKFLSAEFSSTPFERGTVAMARQPGDPHSASCQFFICLKRMRGWDEEYTVFARVAEGIEVADKISKSPLSKNARLKDRPAGNHRIKRIKIEYR